MVKKAKEANVADNCILIEKELSKLNPYYGKDQVIRFIQTVKPRIRNDISKLTA